METSREEIYFDEKVGTVTSFNFGYKFTLHAPLFASHAKNANVLVAELLS